MGSMLVTVLRNKNDTHPASRQSTEMRLMLLAARKSKLRTSCLSQMDKSVNAPCNTQESKLRTSCKSQKANLNVVVDGQGSELHTHSVSQKWTRMSLMLPVMPRKS